MTRKKDPFVSGWGWGSSDTQTRYSRASREYKCDNCGGVIQKGERYTATRPAFQPVGPYITHHWHVYPNGCKAPATVVLNEKDCVEGDGKKATHLHGSNRGLEPCCGQHSDC